MGLPLDRMVEINPTIEFSEPTNYEQHTSLDLMLIQTQNRLLSNELTTLKRSRLPSVSLFGSYGTLGYGYDKSPNQFLEFYSLGLVGLQVKYSLFDGTVTQKKINQKDLEMDNNELQLSLVADKNEMLIANARIEMKSARKLVETSKAHVNLANSVYTNTELQRQNEVASLNDVLQANNTLRESQQNHLSAIIDYLKADLHLKNLLGSTLK